MRNCTDLSNDELYEESSKPYDFQIDGNSSEPQILIYHTHATESFEPTDKDHYDSSFSCKTTEPEMNMLSVGGTRYANSLTKQALRISTIHLCMIIPAMTALTIQAEWR